MDGSGYAERFLTADETREIVRAGLASLSLAGKRVLFIIPDGTRTMPMPQFFGLFREMLAGKAAALDFLVALGTHRPMSDAELSRLVGVPVVDGRAGDSRIYNHEWADPATFATIGEISADEIRQLSGGRLAQPVTVALNRRIFDYDQILICGPVFPHEVVGFSGGNKYFFPGIAAPMSSTSRTGWARSSPITKSSAAATRRYAPSSTAPRRWCRCRPPASRWS